MQPTGATGRHYMVGGGIAALSAAVLLVRDGGVPGDRITIVEHRGTAGGSLDGSGDAEMGYLTRGGRMFEPNFVCTLDLLSGIPAPDDSAFSVRDDIMAFNRMVPGRAECRIVRDGQKAEDRYSLGLGAEEIVALNRLLLMPEGRLEGRSIEDWFARDFFGTNFWIMWSTMFSFQPWHSVAEMRRYMRRFLHLFPGLARIEGILRTRYNQYDSIVAPILAWLFGHGVEVRTASSVADVTIEGDRDGRRVTQLHLSTGDVIKIAPEDRVYLTLGSMTDATVTGDRDAPPPLEDTPSPGFDLWRQLAARHEGLGRPEAFAGHPDRTSWTSFTVTLASPAFVTFMEDFSSNRTGTGGLVTFADSGWLMSIVMLHQPHFRGQSAGRPVFWGYGLRGDRHGDVIAKPMAQATGGDILKELAHQLRLTEEQHAEFFGEAKVIPCRMPFITSQFMPRQTGDRPPVIPRGAENFAVIGQFCELSRDCVFTVEYSVRSAWTAVHRLTGSVAAPPPVVRSDRDPGALLRAAMVLFSS
ncbi:oleate hydratase [Limibaculum sp. FT325]|uniref:oleate hydratase n=1 Tax=Thermohalobaculum sediminis TaxID=2939436 RepID=UPI0020BE1E3A|nr:oleate hydratase [Limibaculum sediminis]MCL5778977.1 oleate hydratase [Limibaculum sediminis]